MLNYREAIERQRAMSLSVMVCTSERFRILLMGISAFIIFKKYLNHSGVGICAFFFFFVICGMRSNNTSKYVWHCRINTAHHPRCCGSALGCRGEPCVIRSDQINSRQKSITSTASQPELRLILGLMCLSNIVSLPVRQNVIY